MEADRGLIEDIEDAHEAGADLGGQADALSLATGKRRRGTRERQVVETDVHEEAQACADLLHDRPTDHLMALIELEMIEEVERLPAGEVAELLDVEVAHRDCQILRLQACAVAGRAGLFADVLLEVCPHGLRRRLLVLLEEDRPHA